MGKLIEAPFGGGAPDVVVSKKQLAQHPAVQRSTRWVENQVNAGLPSELRDDGGQRRRYFRLPIALAWLSERGKLRPGKAPATVSPAPAPPKAHRKQATVAIPSTVRVQVAAGLLGITPKVLGRWERAYGFPRPSVTDGGHRFYAMADLLALRDALAETGDVPTAIRRVKGKGRKPAPAPEPTRTAPRTAALAAAIDELRAEVQRLSARLARLEEPDPIA